MSGETKRAGASTAPVEALGQGEPGASRKVWVPPHAFYVPSPVLIVTTINEDGSYDASAMSAAGALCLEPAIISIGIKPSRRTYRNILRARQFTVCVPTTHDLEDTDYVGTRKMRNEPGKLANTNFTFAPMRKVNAPMINECPLCFGCELITTLGTKEYGITKASHHGVIGRVVESCVDSRYLVDGEVRIEDMPVIVYMNRIYMDLGGKIGEQRFTDDPNKKLEKMKQYRKID